MITKRIIACLDVHGGRVVKGVQFVDLIDAGDPASAYDNEPAPNGKRVNLGAYGNTPQASKTDFHTGNHYVIR